MAEPLVVVVAREQSYVSGDLDEAANRLGIELVFASDRCHLLAEIWPEGSISVDLSEPHAAADVVAQALEGREVSATLGTDETTAVVAEAIALRLGARSSHAGAAARAADKLSTRQALSTAGLLQPEFAAVDLNEPAPQVSFPAVLKPRCLSASRGVMRVNSTVELDLALDRLRSILSDVELRGRFGDLCDTAVIEEYIEGPEVAFDGVLIGGRLTSIAIFDKPRPLEGPCFAESLYIVPSALPESRRQQIVETVVDAAAALGLTEGPLHAELRLGAEQPVVIELAARSIGGLCGRTLTLASGRSVAEIVLGRLCGFDVSVGELAPAGVLMLEPPRAGVFVGMRGLEEAQAVDGVEQIEITAPIGQRVTPLPDGSDYLGFVFARGTGRDEVKEALSRAESLMSADIRPVHTATSS